MSDLISLIARLTLPMDEWPEFWPAMFSLANSADAMHRQVMLGVLEELGDKLFETMRVQMDHLLPFCSSCLTDEDPHVRVASMKAIGVFMGEVREESDSLVPKLKPLVPGILDVINFCLHHGADQEANEGLSIFQAMVELCPFILAPHVSIISQFCLVTAANTDMEWEVRSECLTFLEWVIQFRPSFITKQNLLDPILDVSFNIAAEPESMPFSSWEVTPHRFALQLIDCISRYIRPKYTFDNLMQRVDAWMTSENPCERRAAIGALSAMPNGCCELMVQSIPQFLPYMQAAFEDPDAYVRQAGCILLGQFADFLNPEILEHHATCLPLAYRALCEEDPEIQERALYSLITFMEHLNHAGVDGLFDQIIVRLLHILESSNNKDLQDMAISAITACASAALEKFEPYWEPITKMMQQLMDITAPELLCLRGRALDCVGVISMSIGKELFSPYFEYFMNKSLENFHLQGVEATELRELSINFFANVAEALGTDFVPYLETCLGLVLESLTNVDGSKPELTEESRAMAQLMQDSDDEDDSMTVGHSHNHRADPEDELPPELDGLKYVTNQGLIEEKTVALQTLGTFVHAMGPLFVPHIDRCMEVLQVTSRYVHPKVRSFTIYPMEAFVHSIQQAYPPQRPWVPGEDPEQHPLAPETQHFVDAILEMFTKRIVLDFDLGVVSRYVESLKFIVNTLGAPALHGSMPTIASTILRVLRMETTAHVMETDEGDADNEEITQELLAVFNSACEFIIALAKQYIQGFPLWFPILEGIFTHLNTAVEGEVDPTDDGSESWRQEAVGALAEITEACGVASYSPEQVHILLAHAIKSLGDAHMSTRCNAIYLTRLLTPSPATYDWWTIILNLVVPLLQLDDDQTIDNALGCVAQMIATNPSLCPMAELLPEWLAAFPVRCDQIESGYAYGTLISLLEHSNQDIFPHIPTAFKILIDALGSPVITEETRRKVSATVKSIWGQYSAELQPVLETLDEDGTNNLQTVLQ